MMEEEKKNRKKIEITYTSPSIDTIDNLDELEAIKKQEVEEIVSYFEQVRIPLAKNLQTPLRIMEGKEEDPYSDIRLPENLSTVTLSELKDLASSILNAYLTYGEWLSAARSIHVMRSSLYERRKYRAGINEGTNDLVRKSLSHIRSEPEYMMLQKIDSVKTWLETRYFTYQKMVDAVSQLVTTKSVETSRQMKDFENDAV